ncbi:Mth938-like domain-containing protein [Andreprevotia chitinilytica]|uniref:Mth938-like domain-containing protein n=1 Tax=Andreprevotia chitinilytica TaxID=396808 RepID=UPI0005541422|nr:Mth938-like domain-containing protein [Andreprevotia chitinilytica]
MKLHHTSSEHLNQFTSYGNGFVKVNDTEYQGSLIVTPTEVREWRPASFETLAEEDFASLLELNPEVVLFGTGKGIRFPHPKLSRALAAAHVGMDVMDTGAMCRTFNILTAEERRVIAVVLGA